MKKDYLKRKNHPRQRREYVDYDYGDKLSCEDKEWLSKFTNEFYGADFQINNTFVKVKDIRKVLKELINVTQDNETGDKWVSYLEKIRKNKASDFIQINNCTDNLDLRKFRSVPKYYEDENKNLTTDIKYKYKDTIHDPKKHLKDCNANANASGRDIICNGLKYDSEKVLAEMVDEDCPENLNKIYLSELIDETKILKE